MKSSPGIESTSRWPAAAAAVLLVVLTLAVFAPVVHYDFVQLDDPQQISENAQVARGLTWEGTWWAFTTAHAGYWMPLVWLSHMLDVQMYGMNAGPHHVTNLLLHLLNTLILFGVLWRMTGALTRSALVAALFAVHPLHVESVAWLTERKDVLSTLFWMLTLAAYLAYVRRPGAARYLAVAIAFALGLMAKPMLVTLPFVLLLLDAWPLARAGGGYGAGRGTRPEKAAWRPLILEKMPLLALAAAGSIVAYLTQRSAGAVSTLEVYPLALRVENGLVAYTTYLGKVVWPARLVPFYPHPTSLAAWPVLGSLLLLAVITTVAVRARDRRPYLLVGWLWYLGTLVPVIGLVQIGLQSMADRFTYVPLIGIFIAVAWGLGDLTSRVWSSATARRVLPAAVGMAVLVAFAVAARVQLAYWKDSVAMWTRTTEVTMGTDAYHAHMALGDALRGQGRIDEATAHFSEALRLQPSSAEAHVALALLLAGRPDRADEAIAHYRAALRVKPDVAEVRNNLGSLLAEQGKVDESIAEFAAAARLKPDLEVAHLNLGIALVKGDRIDEAVREFREVLRLNPQNGMARRAVDGLTAGRR